jgi:hypothetical protein
MHIERIPKEMPMNKNELIDAVAERTGLAKSDAARAVEAVLGSVTDALQKGDTVALTGFGTFVGGEPKPPALKPSGAQGSTENPHWSNASA